MRFSSLQVGDGESNKKHSLIVSSSSLWVLHGTLKRANIAYQEQDLSAADYLLIIARDPFSKSDKVVEGGKERQRRKRSTKRAAHFLLAANGCPKLRIFGPCDESRHSCFCGRIRFHSMGEKGVVGMLLLLEFHERTGFCPKHAASRATFLGRRETFLDCILW